MLPIAPSTYHSHLAKRADPARQSDRARRDDVLRPEIRRVFEENYRVYGVRKVWRRSGHALESVAGPHCREGFDVARCSVGRLMKGLGIQGIIRGKPHRTTVPDRPAPRPLDKVNRQFRVPALNMLWVSDFTYVATWKGFALYGTCPRTNGGQSLTFRHRRLCPQDRRLARQHLGACGPPKAWGWFTVRTAARNI